MTNEQEMQAVRRTLEMVMPMADTFAFILYNRFFEMDPGARPLFKADMSGQRAKVMDMLALALRGLDEPEVIKEKLRKLGRQHVTYHVSPEQYDTMNEAIIFALGETLGDKFSDEMRRAWHTALNALTGIMLDAAAEMESAQQPPPA